MGLPALSTYCKIFGAWPTSAKAWRVLVEAYVELFPTLNTEIRMTALMIDGKPLIPASWIAITNGDALRSAECVLARS
jgi:hypothetical protein